MEGQKCWAAHTSAARRVVHGLSAEGSGQQQT